MYLKFRHDLNGSSKQTNQTEPTMTNTAKTTREVTNEVQTYVDFPFKDAKGRHVGAQILRLDALFTAVSDEDVKAISWYRKPAGQYFGFRPWATRNGLRFGAQQDYRYFNTSEEREEAIKTYIAAARDRAAKK